MHVIATVFIGLSTQEAFHSCFLVICVTRQLHNYSCVTPAVWEQSLPETYLYTYTLFHSILFA